MDMTDLIVKKRDGGRLTREEIGDFVAGYTAGKIPDYQAAALLMAIYFRKMDEEETFDLTDAMRFSGNTADLSSIRGIKVDKHSTGGVGDKTTLIACPLAASCGVPVAKMSGRGLGFTGGTVDKMESIPGMRTTLGYDEFLKQVNETGIAVISQSSHIAPADKRLYALRDVTGTVDDLSLISSSIMSKKLASGTDAIVLDVKCGDGAFMKDLRDAEKLAKLMLDIGRRAGKRVAALITDMSQPLGHAVGNSLEVIEAIETLKGKGPDDITELSERLAAMMIFLGGKADSPEEGYIKAERSVENGAGLEKLQRMIEKQGGDPKVTEDYSLFPKAAFEVKVFAEQSGYIKSVGARALGVASRHLGAGRAAKGDSIDLSAGILVYGKVGDAVKKGDLLAVLYGNDKVKLAGSAEEARKAFVITGEKAERPRLIIEILK